MRIVIDTNILIRRIIKPDSKAADVFTAWEQGEFDLIVSEVILEEYHRALLYPHVQKRHQLTVAQVDQTIEDLKELARIVHPTKKLAVVKSDPDDDKFLECAVTGDAAYIVSGDSDLLALGAYMGIQILLPAQFLEVLQHEHV